MAHRGMPEHGRWWPVWLRVLTGAAVLVTAVVLYVLLSLAVHGHVPW
jgi:hypothetical protein